MMGRTEPSLRAISTLQAEVGLPCAVVELRSGPLHSLACGSSGRRCSECNHNSSCLRTCLENTDVPNFCLTARVRYDLIAERARARIRLASSITACQNGRFVAVPERSSCLGLKGDDIRGHLACVCFACGRTRIIRASNLFDPGSFPRG